MTETTFPFSTAQEQPAEADQGGDNRRLAAVLGAGLLAVALVGGAVFAFTGGDDLPVDASFPTAASASLPEAAAPVEQPQTLPVANTEPLARNPFEPKYVEPAPVAETPVAVPVTPAELPVALPTPVNAPYPLIIVPPGALSPATPAPTTPAPATPAPTMPAPTTAAPAPAREYRLVLTDVSAEGDTAIAEFTIDGAVSRVRPTDIFGPNRQLLLRSLQQDPVDGRWSATVQVGDAEPIEVKTNEAVYVQ